MSATPDFLEPRSNLAAHTPAVRVDDKFDDMLDSDAEIAAYTELPLAVCREISDVFRSLDRRALRCQRWHKRVTRFAALAGTLAVMMAILGLALKDKGWVPPALMEWVSRSEIVFALSALALAAIGLSIALKDRWLLYRHQSELCRLLKFRLLLQPSRWGNPDSTQAWIKHALHQIKGLDQDSVREAIEAAFPRFALRDEDALLSPAAVLQLCNYYRSKRISLQRAYLENRAGQNAAKMLLYNKLPTALFFLSVIAAVAHYVLEKRGPESGILFAGLAAACLPVAATWARTIRAAFEHSRNKSRFRAASAALADLEQCLTEDIATGLLPVHGAPPPGLVEAHAPLQDMLWCEQILHTEHIEWLRLMVETEWYG